MREIIFEVTHRQGRQIMQSWLNLDDSLRDQLIFGSAKVAFRVLAPGHRVT